MNTNFKKILLDTMQDEVIKKYGFEDPRTIDFCTKVETIKNLVLIKKIYQKLLENY